MATKIDLINKIHTKIDYLNKEDVESAVNLVLEYLGAELLAKNRIEVRYFGSFSIRERKFPKSEKQYKTIYFRMSQNFNLGT